MGVPLPIAAALARFHAVGVISLPPCPLCASPCAVFATRGDPCPSTNESIAPPAVGYLRMARVVNVGRVKDPDE